MMCTNKQYIQKVNEFVLQRFNPWVWWLLAVLSFFLARAVETWLNWSYALSKFPVPFYIGQTRFSGEAIKADYQFLIDQGTLNIFIQTQLIDYVFMLASFIAFFCLAAAVLRSIPKSPSFSILRRLGIFMLWLTPMGALMDAFENLVSFVMLADPLGFPNWLAYPYSGFAVAKFALFSMGYLWPLCVILIMLMYFFYKQSVRLLPFLKS